MRDNDYIQAAYRPQIRSFRRCFTSAFFQLHNDTINVWTHFVGFIALLCLSWHLLGPATSLTKFMPKFSNCHLNLPPTRLQAAIRGLGLPNVCIRSYPAHAKEALASILNSHRIGLLPLLLTSILCLAFSTIYHAFWVHSQATKSVLVKLDFFGIVLLCCGHALSGIYSTFYCTPSLAKPYYRLAFTTMLVTLPAIFSPSFASPAARPFRTLVFCCLGATSIAPVAHAIWLHQFRSYELAVAVGSAIAALIMYGIGAVLYVVRFPECCRKGKHDRFLASHQLMHLSVMVGVALHLWGCWTLFEYRMEVGCSASPVVNVAEWLSP